jgi:hypothetical protein
MEARQPPEALLLFTELTQHGTLTTAKCVIKVGKEGSEDVTLAR